MMLGWCGGSDAPSIDAAVARAREARDAGFATFWFPQVTGLDALVALAVVARKVPDIHVATAVVPIQGRHPLPLALAALTVADAAGPGRFTLGLGVTHPPVSEGWFGVPYLGIVDACAETLTALAGLFSAERRADLDGAHLSVHASTAITAAAPGVILAAMGPRMVRLAGSQADGTLTSSLMPAHRRQIDLEGVAAPVDLAVVGDEDAVAAHLDRFLEAGMTELCANLLGAPEDKARTASFLAARYGRPLGTGVANER